MVRGSCILSCLVALLSTSATRGTADPASWPEWRNEGRTGISLETGLLKHWPPGGPNLLWSVDGLGKGFAAVSVADGRIYVTGSADEKEIAFAFDMNGKKQWQTTYGPMWTKNFPSARSTPTVDDGRLYVVSTLGKVVCLKASDGAIVWQVDMKERFGLRDISWGINESPLVEDGKVICTAGGEEIAIAALDKKTGKTVWKTTGLSDKAAYCSPLLVEHAGRKQVVTMMSHHIIGVDLGTGKLLWTYPYKGRCSAHAVTPIYSDGILFATSGYNDGAVALKLSPKGDAVSLLWKDKTLDTHHGGVVLLDGHLYGSNWKNNRDGKWYCAELKTGKIQYETPWKCKGSVTAADGMLYCYEEKDGNVALVPVTPKEFKPVSTFKVTKGSDKHWAHPVICGGRLYMRHGEALMAYDIKAR